MSTRFELHGGLDSVVDDLNLGPWVRKPRQPAQTGPLMFASGPPDDDNDDDDQPPRWQVDIDPADLAGAYAAFDRGERSVAHTEAQIGTVLARIDRAMRTGAANPANLASDMPDAEAELLLDMDTLRQPEPTQAGGPLTFGLVSDGWDAIAAKAKKALDSVLRVATYPSWVETRVAGRLLARSTVTWTGDTVNVGSQQLTAELINIHARSVAMSIRTRNAWTRLLVTLVHGSARIAATVGPTGAVMALPMAWSFARRVLAEVEQLRAVYQMSRA